MNALRVVPAAATASSISRTSVAGIEIRTLTMAVTVYPADILVNPY
jgi:hypothetical protein